MSAVDLDALIAELRTPIRVQHEEKPNHVLRRANVSRLNAAKALEDLRRAPVSAGKVKALDPEQLVADWMAESEGFATRGERFMGTIMDGNDVAPWLHAACKVGIEAALGIQRGDGWQGIESAPKDGEPFIAALKLGHLWDFAVMLWHEGEEDWTDSFGAIIGCPTHWMPLPAPPASLPQGEETK